MPFFCISNISQQTAMSYQTAENMAVATVTAHVPHQAPQHSTFPKDTALEHLGTSSTMSNDPVGNVDKSSESPNAMNQLCKLRCLQEKVGICRFKVGRGSYLKELQIRLRFNLGRLNLKMECSNIYLQTGVNRHF